MSWKIWFFFLSTLFFSLGGQVLLKKGLQVILGGKPVGVVEFLREHLWVLFRSWPPYALLGLCSCALGMVCWLFILSHTELTRALPILGALGYLGIYGLGRFVLKEETTGLQLWGILLICAGIFLLSKKGSGA